MSGLSASAEGDGMSQTSQCFTGFRALFAKECNRFLKVWLQTIGSPVITALLYQFIFSHVMSARSEPLPGVDYVSFLIPGLIMMSMMQNAIANSSSSLVQSKIGGSIVFVLLPPINSVTFYSAYALACIVRGFVVGAGVYAVTSFFALPIPVHPLWMLAFAFLACAVMGTLGVIAGIYAEKFDQMAGFQNFVVMPLTFLSGVFYSINSLPEPWRSVSFLNPMFYMIDGFRYGFFGQSDASPYFALGFLTVVWLLLAALTIRLLDVGWRLRS